MTDIKLNSGCAVALGNFDGMHVGHVAVLNQTALHAQSLAAAVKHIFARAKQFRTRHQRAALLAAAAAQHVQPPKRRRKEREHPVVLTVRRMPQHDGVGRNRTHYS